MTGARSRLDTDLARGTPPVAAHPDRACAGVPTEVFYRQVGGPPTKAIAICDLCKHREPCLEWALETRQMFGVWAGTTPEERAQMIKDTEVS